MLDRVVEPGKYRRILDVRFQTENEEARRKSRGARQSELKWTVKKLTRSATSTSIVGPLKRARPRPRLRLSWSSACDASGPIGSILSPIRSNWVNWFYFKLARHLGLIKMQLLHRMPFSVASFPSSFVSMIPLSCALLVAWWVEGFCRGDREKVEFVNFLSLLSLFLCTTSAAKTLQTQAR